MPLAIKDVLQNIAYIRDHWKIDLLKNWPSVIGALHIRVTLEKIDDTAVTIGVGDACWLQELYMLSSQLCARINQHLDKPRIQKIYFRKIDGAPTAHKKRSLCKMEVATINYQVHFSPKERAALNKITDRELQEALKKFYRRLLPG